MAKITNPIRFSKHFGCDPELLKELGVLNPTLNADVRLFIDPLLLEGSLHKEMCAGAHSTYQQHFTKVIKLLRGSQQENDAAWKGAVRLLSFPEIKWTCLGYGANSVSGSGSGTDTTGQLVQTAKEIINLGVEDPDLFVAMALFETGFGPDRISDMTANVILKDLLDFNARVLAKLPVTCHEYQLSLRNGTKYTAMLPPNPFVKEEPPIVLVPADILRELPIAKDWEEIATAAAQNEELRNYINTEIAALWKSRTLEDKAGLRKWALSGEKEFQHFLKMIRSVEATPYDLGGDPAGEVFWQDLVDILPGNEPLLLTKPAQLDIDGVLGVVEQIIEQFKFLIEKRRFSEELYHAGKRRPEKSAQRLFYAVAYSYCKANDLDITPEADTGNGPVDFKVASGFSGRVVVEIKLSSNGKLVKGYTHQLQTYKDAEETMKGHYIVINVGAIGEKFKKLLDARNEAVDKGEVVSPITLIDGTPKPPASKL